MTATASILAAPCAPPRGAAAGRPAPSHRAITDTWLALHDAAGVVAALAGLPVEPLGPDECNFPTTIRDAADWQYRLADQGIGDLSAILQTGLAALLGVHATGSSPQAAAQALWEEFVAARDALMALNCGSAAERQLPI